MPVSRMMYWRDWIQLGESLFGPDQEQWRFHCMHCGKASYKWEGRVKWEGLDKNRMGQWCPHCEKQAIPFPSYGYETSFRVLVMPEDMPCYKDLEPNGRMIYAMPFWAPDSPGDKALQTIVNLDDVIPDSAMPPNPLGTAIWEGGANKPKVSKRHLSAPSPKAVAPTPPAPQQPAPVKAPAKKGAPGGYGFKF